MSADLEEQARTLEAAIRTMHRGAPAMTMIPEGTSRAGSSTLPDRYSRASSQRAPCLPQNSEGSPCQLPQAGMVDRHRPEHLLSQQSPSRPRLVLPRAADVLPLCCLLARPKHSACLAWLTGMSRCLFVCRYTAGSLLPPAAQALPPARPARQVPAQRTAGLSCRPQPMLVFNGDDKQAQG